MLSGGHYGTQAATRYWGACLENLKGTAPSQSNYETRFIKSTPSPKVADFHFMPTLEGGFLSCNASTRKKK